MVASLSIPFKLAMLCVTIQVEKAMEIFEDMSRFGCERNVTTYSSLISACEKASLVLAVIPLGMPFVTCGPAKPTSAPGLMILRPSHPRPRCIESLLTPMA